MMRKRPQNYRLAQLGGAVFSCLIFLTGLGLFLIYYSETPLPDAWNPTKNLNVSDAVTPLTGRKLRKALSDDGLCIATLAPAATFDILPDLEESDLCHIKGHVKLRTVRGVNVTPVSTRCQTSLRVAMWMEHGIAPAARDLLGQEVTDLIHLSSYNCRPIRTGRSGETRMSTHATAEAIDITGVRLADGRTLTLLKGWDGTDADVRAFMRSIRDSACTWFRTTLGPDYNDLHADHFHLQHTGWGTCR